MDRLTKQINGEACHYDCNGPCGTCDGCTCFAIGQMVDRLAAYEDICYSEDGTERISLDRLRALAKADRDGRCVVLGEYPAKNRYDAADYLSDWIKEEEFEDRSVGIYAIQSDVGDVVHGVIDALNAGRSEAEDALSGKEDKP